MTHFHKNCKNKLVKFIQTLVKHQNVQKMTSATNELRGEQQLEQTQKSLNHPGRKH